VLPRLELDDSGVKKFTKPTRPGERFYIAETDLPRLKEAAMDGNVRAREQLRLYFRFYKSDPEQAKQYAPTDK
jgi:hypothetical protein